MTLSSVAKISKSDTNFVSLKKRVSKGTNAPNHRTCKELSFPISLGIVPAISFTPFLNTHSKSHDMLDTPIFIKSNKVTAENHAQKLTQR